MITLTEPTIARFDESYNEGSKRRQLEAHLKYIDKKLDYEIKRLKNSAHWYTDREDEYNEKLEELKKARHKSLLFEDKHGLYTYSGLAPSLAEKFNDTFHASYSFPDPPDNIPYANVPKHKPRYYQVQAHNELGLTVMHGPRRVEIGTGLGKSTIIRLLLKTYPHKAVIMAPSTNIAEQLYNDLCHHFGKRYVGLYGAGKKQSDKLFVVGIDDSLTKVEPSSEHWKNLSSAKIFIADESHLCPAESLAKVCLGLCKDAPFRFFFSATQIRNDGLDLLLDGITGSTVYSKTVREGVDEGFLAKPLFTMVRTTSDKETYSSDPNKLTRTHLYYNDRVNRLAALHANRFVSVLKKPTVILVEELEQFTKLLPYLKHGVKFAHGPLNKDTRKLVPKEYQDDDPSDLVKLFNEGKIPILVGTSCISTGTDIQVAEAMIYLQGKSSEVKTKQAVGRATRGGKESFVFNPWTGEQKLDCLYLDFDIVNVDNVHRHALIRQSHYEEIYGPVSILDL